MKKHKKHGDYEQMSVQFAVQDVDLEQNSFRGMASVFNNLIDTWVPTRILPGAFSKTLQENARRIKVLYQHNPDWLLGLPTRLEETSDGLLVEARISQTAMGKDCMVLLRDKVLTELSIGFDPIRHEMVEESVADMKTQVRLVNEVRLWEVSPVTWGANSRAQISSVNALSRGLPMLAGSSPDLQAYLGIVWEQFAAKTEAEPADLMQVVTHVLHERHVGKMLSGKNKQLVSECRDLLQQLLDAAEPVKDEESLPLTVDVVKQLKALESQFVDAMSASYL